MVRASSRRRRTEEEEEEEEEEGVPMGRASTGGSPQRGMWTWPRTTFAALIGAY